MPMSHEQAAIDAATGRRRERLIEAAAVLDRVRAENPGIENIPDLPAEARSAARAAHLTFRAALGLGFGELVLAGVLAIGLGAAWLKPVRLFRCAPQAEGLAQCVVADRAFGVVPRCELTVVGIAKTTVHSAHVSESRDRDGKIIATATLMEDLTLTDADGRPLWSGAVDNMVGATLAQVSADVEAIVSGEGKAPALRIQAFWPVLLLASVLVLLSLGGFVSQIGLTLLDWGLIPQGLYRLFFARAGFLLSVAFCSVAWALVLLGRDPPALVARLLGLG